MKSHEEFCVGLQYVWKKGKKEVQEDAKSGLAELRYKTVRTEHLPHEKKPEPEVEAVGNMGD